MRAQLLHLKGVDGYCMNTPMLTSEPCTAVRLLTRGG